MIVLRNVLIILLWLSIIITSILGNYGSAILSMMILLFFKLSDIEDKIR